MAKSTIDLSGKLGLAPHWFGDIEYSVSAPNLRYIDSASVDGMTATGLYNPFKRAGYLAPSTTATKNVTASGNAFFRPFTVTQYDALNTRIFCGGGNIHLTYGNIDSTAWSVTTGSILNNNNGYQDLEIYQINGVPYLYALYINGSSVQCIAVMNITGAGTSFAANNLVGTSGTITGNFALSGSATKMISADNGFMYLLDNNAIEKIDGSVATGGASATLSQALVFPVNIALSDGIDYRGNLYVGVQQAANTFNIGNFTSLCGIYVWDRVSTAVSQQDFIPIPQAHAIRKIYVSGSGNIRAIVTLNNGETAIVEYTGYSFVTISRQPVTSFPPYIDSATVVTGGIWWQGYDTNIYFYGKPSYEQKEGLYLVGQFAAALSIGQIMIYGSGSGDYSPSVPTNSRQSPEGFFIAYRDVTGATYYLKKWYPFADSNAPDLIALPVHAGNVYTLNLTFPTLANINYIRIYHAPLGSAGSTVQGTLSTYLNQVTTATRTDSITQTDVARGYKYLSIGQKLQGSAFSIQFQIAWPNDGTVVSDGTTNWMPRSVEIDWDVTPQLL